MWSLSGEERRNPASTGKIRISSWSRARVCVCVCLAAHLWDDVWQLFCSSDYCVSTFSSQPQGKHTYTHTHTHTHTHGRVQEDALCFNLLSIAQKKYAFGVSLCVCALTPKPLEFKTLSGPDWKIKHVYKPVKVRLNARLFSSYACVSMNATQSFLKIILTGQILINKIWPLQMKGDENKKDFNLRMNMKSILNLLTFSTNNSGMVFLCMIISLCYSNV